jgi:hypothetical protein
MRNNPDDHLIAIFQCIIYIFQKQTNKETFNKMQIQNAPSRHEVIIMVTIDFTVLNMISKETISIFHSLDVM